MHKVIEFGHKARTTHRTAANDTSSRSHAICQIFVTRNNQFCGKLILCDLAGSERAADTQSNSRQRRVEGAEINKSLLALKECIRAMNAKLIHIPFRASKLTLALRDSFLTQNVNSSKIVMIACVCPGSKSSDHTINTLRYADRLKEKQNKKFDNVKPPPMIKPNGRSDSVTKPAPAGPNPQINAGLKARAGGVIPAGNKYGGGGLGSKQDIDALDQFVANEVNGNPGGGLGTGLGDHQGLGKELNQKRKQESRSISKNQEISKHGKNVQNVPNMVKKPSKESKQKLNPFKQIEVSDSSEEENEEKKRKKEKKRGYKADMDLMKTTLKIDNAIGPIDDQMFDYQEKVDDVLEMHDEILAMHMNILKKDAASFTKETDLYSKAQNNTLDNNVDNYLSEIEMIVRQKIYQYQQFAKKIDRFKKVLKEEEEIHSKVRSTFYY